MDLEKYNTLIESNPRMVDVWDNKEQTEKLIDLETFDADRTAKTERFVFSGYKGLFLDQENNLVTSQSADDFYEYYDNKDQFTYVDPEILNIASTEKDKLLTGEPVRDFLPKGKAGTALSNFVENFANSLSFDLIDLDKDKTREEKYAESRLRGEAGKVGAAGTVAGTLGGLLMGAKLTGGVGTALTPAKTAAKIAQVSKASPLLNTVIKSAGYSTPWALATLAKKKDIGESVETMAWGVMVPVGLGKAAKIAGKSSGFIRDTIQRTYWNLPKKPSDLKPIKDGLNKILRNDPEYFNNKMLFEFAKDLKLENIPKNAESMSKTFKEEIINKLNQKHIGKIFTEATKKVNKFIKGKREVPDSRDETFRIFETFNKKMGKSIGRLRKASSENKKFFKLEGSQIKKSVDDVLDEFTGAKTSPKKIAVSKLERKGKILDRTQKDLSQKRKDLVIKKRELSSVKDKKSQIAHKNQIVGFEKRILEIDRKASKLGVSARATKKSLDQTKNSFNQTKKDLSIKKRELVIKKKELSLNKDKASQTPIKRDIIRIEKQILEIDKKASILGVSARATKASLDKTQQNLSQAKKELSIQKKRLSLLKSKKPEIANKDKIREIEKEILKLDKRASKLGVSAKATKESLDTKKDELLKSVRNFLDVPDINAAKRIQALKNQIVGIKNYTLEELKLFRDKFEELTNLAKDNADLKPLAKMAKSIYLKLSDLEDQVIRGSDKQIQNSLLKARQTNNVDLIKYYEDLLNQVKTFSTKKSSFIQSIIMKDTLDKSMGRMQGSLGLITESPYAERILLYSASVGAGSVFGGFGGAIGGALAALGITKGVGSGYFLKPIEKFFDNTRKAKDISNILLKKTKTKFPEKSFIPQTVGDIRMSLLGDSEQNDDMNDLAFILGASLGEPSEFNKGSGMNVLDEMHDKTKTNNVMRKFETMNTAARLEQTVLENIPLTKPGDVEDKIKKEKFIEDVSVLFSPDALLKNVENNTLTGKQVNNFKKVYPRIYSKLKKDIIQDNSKSPLMNRMDYNTVLMLSRLTETDLTGLQGFYKFDRNTREEEPPQAPQHQRSHTKSPYNIEGVSADLRKKIYSSKNNLLNAENW